MRCLACVGEREGWKVVGWITGRDAELKRGVVELFFSLDWKYTRLGLGSA